MKLLILLLSATFAFSNTYFISSNKSGSNLVTTTLTAMTRKPISWMKWEGEKVVPGTEVYSHPSTNRLRLPLISTTPLLYRTHGTDRLWPLIEQNHKLIFLTRNPKELMFRQFALENISTPTRAQIDTFLDRYLERFYLFEKWSLENKLLIFYEDFRNQSSDALTLSILDFMHEKATYLHDFRTNRIRYLDLIFQSYANHHKNEYSNRERAPRETHLDRVSHRLLKEIDRTIERKAQTIWKKYLHRYQTR